MAYRSRTRSGSRGRGVRRASYGRRSYSGRGARKAGARRATSSRAQTIRLVVEAAPASSLPTGGMTVAQPTTLRRQSQF